MGKMLKKKSAPEPEEIPQQEVEIDPEKVVEFKQAYRITEKKLTKAYTKQVNLAEDIHSMELSLDYFKEELMKMGIDIEEDDD